MEQKTGDIINSVVREVNAGNSEAQSVHVPLPCKNDVRNRSVEFFAALLSSCLSLVLSIIALCVSAYRSPELSFDYMGVLVGILGILVTVVLGWQIYDRMTVERRIRNIASEISMSATMLSHDLSNRGQLSIYATMSSCALNSRNWSSYIIAQKSAIPLVKEIGDSSLAEDIANATLEAAPVLIPRFNEEERERYREYLDEMAGIANLSPKITEAYIKIRPLI